MQSAPKPKAPKAVVTRGNTTQPNHRPSQRTRHSSVPGSSAGISIYSITGLLIPVPSLGYPDSRRALDLMRRYPELQPGRSRTFVHSSALSPTEATVADSNPSNRHPVSLMQAFLSVGRPQHLSLSPSIFPNAQGSHAVLRLGTRNCDVARGRLSIAPAHLRLDLPRFATICSA